MHALETVVELLLVLALADAARGDDAALGVVVHAGDEHEDLVVGADVDDAGIAGIELQLIEHVLAPVDGGGHQLAEIDKGPVRAVEADRADGEDDVAAVFIGGIEGDDRVLAVEADVLVIAQAAEHQAVFHVVRVEQERIGARIEPALLIEEDRAVDVVIAEVIAAQVVFVVPLDDGLVDQPVDLQPADDVLVLALELGEAIGHLGVGVFRIIHRHERRGLLGRRGARDGDFALRRHAGFLRGVCGLRGFGRCGFVCRFFCRFDGGFC